MYKAMLFSMNNNIGDSTKMNSARGDPNATRATEAEERLLGVGQLPRDVEAEQEMREAVRRAIGPPEPVLD
ncbi:hypothetical protein M3Y99_00426700 [Aphelenchoides fujianensis]|nr:hypothetical protein M3Y99_00426700 [Aphelenchoides fujianensis]